MRAGSGAASVALRACELCCCCPGGLSTPAQSQRVRVARQFEQTGASCRVERREGMTHGVARDDASLGHHHLGRAQAALAVLEVDEWQDSGIRRGSLVTPPCAMMVKHRLDQVRQQRTGHRAGGACVEIGHECDRFLTVEGRGNRITSSFDQSAQRFVGPAKLLFGPFSPGDVP